LAVFNTTSFRVEITLRGTKKATFKRTCDPSTVCAFDNIQIANYAIEIRLDEKVIIKRKCWAKGTLFTLIETRDSNVFKLEGNKDTFIFHLKRGAPLGFELDGRQVVRVLKGFKRPLKVGWTLDQVGPVVLKNLNPDQPSGGNDVDRQNIVKFRRGIEEKIFKLVYSTFSGTVVLVFNTSTERRSSAQSESIEEGAKACGLSSSRSKKESKKDCEIMVSRRIELGEAAKMVKKEEKTKRSRRFSWPVGSSSPDNLDSEKKSEHKSPSTPPARIFQRLTRESPALKNIFSWSARPSSKSSQFDEISSEPDAAKTRSRAKSLNLFSKMRSRIKEQIIEVQSTIYSPPKIKYTFPVLKEWFVLIETHRLLLVKEREAIRSLVLNLQNAFEQEQVLMAQKLISVPDDGLYSDQEELENVKPQELDSEDKEDGSTPNKRDDSPIVSIEILAPTSLVVEENVENDPGDDRENNSCTTPKAIAEEHAEVNVMRYDDVDENDADIDDAGGSAEEYESPPTEVKNELPTNPLKIKNTLSNKVPDTRKFEYPFVEAVKRLSTVGLELHDLDPVKFLEHEVHYVQASLEAQVAITGEPYELGSEQNCAPGWSVCYMDSTSKVYWVRDSDGATSLDPPTEDFWVLLANPFEPLNPFPYPAVG